MSQVMQATLNGLGAEYIAKSGEAPVIIIAEIGKKRRTSFYFEDFPRKDFKEFIAEAMRKRQ